jgi:hypothetical protein
MFSLDSCVLELQASPLSSETAVGEETVRTWRPKHGT